MFGLHLLREISVPQLCFTRITQVFTWWCLSYVRVCPLFLVAGPVTATQCRDAFTATKVKGDRVT